MRGPPDEWNEEGNEASLPGYSEIGIGRLRRPWGALYMFYVYVLRSLKNHYRYIGHTNNLNKRLAEHNSGLTKSIRFQIPFEVEYVEQCSTRLEAIRREKFLKSGKGREWLDKNVKCKKIR